MYNMMSQFMKEAFKYAQKQGRWPTRAHDLGDVFMGSYCKQKPAFCYRGEFFFVVPDCFDVFDKSLYQLVGPDFGNLAFNGDLPVAFDGIVSHPSDKKKLLRRVQSADHDNMEIFERRVTTDGISKTEHRSIAFIQDKYAKWFETLDAFYGHMTELVTNGKGAIVLKRVNGDVIAVTLEVRI